MADEPDTPLQTLLGLIRVEEANRETLMRDLLDLAERGQDTAEAWSALRQTEDNLDALREWVSAPRRPGGTALRIRS